MLDALFSMLPDDAACLELIDRFDPLLKKYATKLAYEDAYEDLRLFFIELINKMHSKDISKKSDGNIVNYIVRSINNHYIFLSKAHYSFEIPFTDLSDEQMVFIDFLHSEQFETPEFDFFVNNNILNKREIEVLYMYYILQISVKEIAAHFNVSRQAVNQTKLRAIEKLKETLAF